MAALGAMDPFEGAVLLRQDVRQSEHAVGGNQRVATAGGRGNWHREVVRVQLGRTTAVFVGPFLLCSAKRRGDGVLELVILDEVRRPVHRDNAVDLVRMQGGERQGGGTTHGPAAEDDFGNRKTSPQRFDDLQGIGFGRGPHPGGPCAIVRRDVDHSVLCGGIAGGATFVSLILHELPAIGTVAV